MLAAGCAVSAPPASAPLDGSAWVLTELDGASAPRASLSFDGARASGVGPCNSFMGDVSRVGGGLAIGPVVATRRSCADEAREVRYFSALTDVARAEARGETLVLRDEAGVALMRFKRGL